MYEVLRKDFIINIFWKEVKYNQFSLYDCIEFSYLLKEKDFKLEDWVFDFLKDKIDIKKIDLLNIDLNKFMDVLFDTAFRGFFSKWKWKGESMPYESYLMFLSDKFNIHPDKLLKTYTPEQISFYTEWIIYNLNEQTKDGQKKNKINRTMKELRSEKPIEETKKEIEELKKRMDKKDLINNK